MALALRIAQRAATEIERAERNVAAAKLQGLEADFRPMVRPRCDGVLSAC